MKFYGSKRVNRRELSQLIGNNISRKIKRENESNNKSPDTIERQSIREDIIKLIKEGKGRIFVLDYLLNKYEDSKLSIYFEQWYEYYYDEIRKEQLSKEDNEGR